MLKKASLISIIVLLAGICSFAQAPQSASDVVIILPFENASGKGEFNWVGESFADSLPDLLKVQDPLVPRESKLPTLKVVSNQERKAVQLKLRVPLTSVPSLATSIKIAKAAGATWLVYGRYTIIPAEGESTASINVNAKIVRVNEARFLTETFDDRARQIPPLELTDALGRLQSIHGQLAYKILYFHDKTTLGVSQNSLIVAANKVPPRAFEAYIKGLLTSDLASRENYFKNASRLYSEFSSGAIYTDAELELGHLYLSVRKGVEAIASFERVISQIVKCRDKAKAEKKLMQCGDESYAEASFYIGMIYLQQGNFESAISSLRSLTEDLKLTTVYNALGAIAVQASRAEKKNPAKAAAMLADGIELLKKAFDSSPDDASIIFNYATALFLNGDFVGSANQMRNVIVIKSKDRSKDGEAYYILAKALESLKDPQAAAMGKEAQLLLTDNNKFAKLQVEWEKNRALPDISLRVVQPARKDFVALVLSNRPVTVAQQVSETDTLLAQARAFIKGGNDDDAMATLRRVLASEPMSAEIHLLLGKIHLRHSDIDQAIASFKTTIFWDNRLIEAHIGLGKIYVEKGDCLQAKTYAAQSLAIDPDNQDAIALQRLSERCSK